MSQPHYTSQAVRGIASRVTVGTLALALAAAGAGCNGPVDPKLEQRFIADLPTATMVVFPSVVRSQQIAYDNRAAEAFAAALRDAGIAASTASDHVPIIGGWGHNQARMFRNSIESFARYVAANSVDADYAVLAEYLMLPNKAGGVHVYVVDRHGQIMAGFLRNSHHDVFSKANPKTADDCTKLAIEVFEDEFLK